MARKRLKRTDQEWFSLIQDCKTSDLKVNVWCEQHNVTLKALYYHSRRLQQKGYVIPQRAGSSITRKKPEIVCLDISDGILADRVQPPYPDRETADTAVRVDFHGVFIHVSNHAAQDTIANVFRALQDLC